MHACAANGSCMHRFAAPSTHSSTRHLHGLTLRIAQSHWAQATVRQASPRWPSKRPRRREIHSRMRPSPPAAAACEGPRAFLATPALKSRMMREVRAPPFVFDDRGLTRADGRGSISQGAGQAHALTVAQVSQGAERVQFAWRRRAAAVAEPKARRAGTHAGVAGTSAANTRWLWAQDVEPTGRLSNVFGSSKKSPPDSAYRTAAWSRGAR